MPQRLHINPDPCTGCFNCMMACSQHRSGAADPNSAAIRIDLDPFEGNHTIRFCMQCHVPKCQEACRFNAIFRSTRTDAWLVNTDLCTGCRDCVAACPFQAMMFDEARRKAFKCNHCDGSPECVDACHFGAIHWCSPNTIPPKGIPAADIDPQLGRG